AKILERLQQASQVCFQVTCSLYFKARTQNRTHKMTEGIGETEISPTPSVSSEPGRPGVTALRRSHHGAHRPV
ncbi:MAG: hypothetical protein WBV76_22190, partial [Pseudolabrys sp.]